MQTTREHHYGLCASWLASWTRDCRPTAIFPTGNPNRRARRIAFGPRCSRLSLTLRKDEPNPFIAPAGTSAIIEPPPRRICLCTWCLCHLFFTSDPDREQVDLYNKACRPFHLLQRRDSCQWRSSTHALSEMSLRQIALSYPRVVGPHDHKFGSLPIETRTGYITHSENAFQQWDMVAHPSQRPTVSPAIVTERQG